MSEAVPLVDIGANLCDPQFATDREAVLARAAVAGVARIVVTGSDVASSSAAIELSRSHPAMLRATAGVHPHCSASFDTDTLNRIAALSRDPMVCAIGETGLDFNRDYAPRDAQERAFAAQLELAAETGLPLFLHERDAFERFAAILAPLRQRLGKVVVHCFTGSRQALFRYLDLDCHIGITGWICDERRGRRLQSLAQHIPLQRLMIETDSPWLLPRNLPQPPPVRRRNEPSMLPQVLKTLAACRKQSPELLAHHCCENALHFFSLPPLEPQPRDG